MESGTGNLLPLPRLVGDAKSLILLVQGEGVSHTEGFSVTWAENKPVPKSKWKQAVLAKLKGTLQPFLSFCFLSALCFKVFKSSLSI